MDARNTDIMSRQKDLQISESVTLTRQLVHYGRRSRESVDFVVFLFMTGA